MNDARTLRWVALLVTYLQAMNLSLPNAALRLIQGSLSMSDDEAGWIFTAYLAASAITLPLAPWLAARVGLKTLYQVAIAGFALGLLLATCASTTLQFIGARLVQGVAAGVLAPLSMAIALETLAPAARPKFGPLWTVIGLLGIVSGPGIGGWVCEHFGWRALFYASLPLLALITLGVALLLPAKKPGATPPFDFFGFACFTLGMLGLQMVLDRGQRLEWFDSPQIWLGAVASGVGFYLFGVHRFTCAEHFISKALLRDRNFLLSTLIFFAVGFVLLSTMALTSPMLDELLGYPPDTTGLLTVPRGVGLLAAFWLMNRVPAHLDGRAFVAVGIAVVVYANHSMLGYSPLMDRWPVALAGAIQGAGLGLLMPALSRVAFSTLDPALRAEGTGLFNLVRVYGSTLGVAVVQWFFFNNTQTVHVALASQLTAHGLPASMPLAALAGLNEAVTGQAAFIAVLGQFKILMWAMLAVSPLVLLLRKPLATH
ncbi:MFS transporter [Pseudomonas sp. SDO528_S397]